MPYKPTGRPNGRPRKTPTEQAESPEQADATSARVAASRARKMFRQVAETLNPSPFLVIYDNRGRPRHRPRHTSLKV